MKARNREQRKSRSMGSTCVNQQARASVRKEQASPQLVQIEKPIYGGSFLTHLEGRAVFVPLVLPGEQARVRVMEEKRSYATAEADEIISCAPERIPAACPYFGPCGGCQYQHADYSAQLRFKQAILRETLERGRVHTPDEIEILSGVPWSYRNRIRLAFDPHGNPGYRGRRSHHVIPSAQCPIAAPLPVKAAAEFAQLVRVLAPAFHPTELALFCNREETSLIARVFSEKPGTLDLDGLARALWDRIPALTGLELVIDGRAGKVPHPVSRWGESSLSYRAAGFDYRVDHGAFFQVNRWLVELLVERVIANRKGSVAWDLFAGVGLFARRLAAVFERVVAVESAPSATGALAQNLSGASASTVTSTTLEFLRRSRKGEPPDLIVVDPPRTGLGSETTSLLAELAAPSVTYVSCDPATLARDLHALLAVGYAIERLTLADLFPQTFHIEAIVDLRLA